MGLYGIINYIISKQPQNEPDPSEPIYIPDSCDAILDTAKTIYAEEQDRFTQYENKINIGLAFAGVILVAYMTYLGANELSLQDKGYLVYSIFFRISVLISFTMGIVYFLVAIKSGEYQQVNLLEIVDLNFAQDSVETVKFELAATYKKAIDKNKPLLHKKTKYYDLGLTFITIGFLTFVIYFIIEEVIRYV